ncbi:MAG TPA: phosphoglycerate kinase [Candidatus Solibacter sp.]|nr:phosphoglycerate kinase [Candidatus Solibacter sp.]
MTLRTLDRLDVEGKRVLLRVDFNVPMEGSTIVDDSRIRQSLPTFRALLEGGASILVVTHIGRPNGKVDPALSVRPAADRLGQLFGLPVDVAEDVVGPSAQAIAHGMRQGQVAMLENVRFEPGEEANDPGFADMLAGLADCYVNDAFGTAHRAHASTVGVAARLPSAAGLLMQREVEFLGRILSNPEQPLVAIVGGAKISTKIGVMESLLPRVSRLLVGGAMACTLLKAAGAAVGSSKIEEDQLDTARRLMADAGDKLVLPPDAVVADAFAPDARTQVVASDAIPDGWMMLDVGPKTVEDFGAVVGAAGTVVWNGPLGVYEMEPFRHGTEALARAVAASHAVSVIGGGDLAAAVASLGLDQGITHISTGGGATLEFLEGKNLPGIAALEDAA